MIFYIPKIKINNLKLNKTSIKETYTESISNTTSKLIGTFSHFLEPIILTNMLLFMGYTKDYIVYEYGIINAYSLSLLLMPQFFTQNMSTSLIPELSKYYSIKNYKMCIKRIKQVILLSSFIGVSSTIIITLFPNFFLNLLYKTSEGIDYIRLLSPFIILFYIQYPLSNSIQALGKSKIALKISIISSIIRLISIIILTLLNFGIYSLIFSLIINLIITTYLYYKEIKITLSN
jgi:stage V sporulation protein B